MSRPRRKPRFKSHQVKPGETGFRGNQLMIGKILQCADDAGAADLKRKHPEIYGGPRRDRSR